eukprot:7011769-Alexandrium_andersonii.AAC.1
MSRRGIAASGRPRLLSRNCMPAMPGRREPVWTFSRTSMLRARSLAWWSAAWTSLMPAQRTSRQ